MLLFNARKNSQGFTLIETLIIVFIIGILSAIAAPSFLGMLNRNKVNNALTQVRGALQEAQREAMRRSRKCQVALTVGNQPKLTSNCFNSADYTIKASAAATSGATTVSVDSLPVAIFNDTRLVFSGGATGVVTLDAAAASNSLTLSGGISADIATGEIVAFRTLPDGVGLQTDISGQKIQFGLRGNTSGAGTIALFMTDGSTPLKRCIVTSVGIGIMRSGVYSGSNSSASDITAGTCATSP